MYCITGVTGRIEEVKYSLSKPKINKLLGINQFRIH